MLYLQINQNKARWSDVLSNCRNCGGESETLPYVICHCQQHMIEIEERHPWLGYKNVTFGDPWQEHEQLYLHQKDR